jgi:hypothetical protein
MLSENADEVSEFDRVNFHDLCEDESCLGSASVRFIRFEGLEAVEELLEVIRNLLAGKTIAKTFIYLRDLLEKLDQSFHACLLREIIHCENIGNQAKKIQIQFFLRFILSKVLNANTASQLLLHSSTVSDACKILYYVDYYLLIFRRIS